MSPLILLGLLAGVPLLLFALLRVKPLYLFVSIVTGHLWVLYLGDPADLVIRSATNVPNPESVSAIGLLLIPLLITLLLMRKTLSASALPFQFFLLVANAILLAILVIDLLPGNIQNDLTQTNEGNIVRQLHDIAIAAIAGLHVLVMWIMRSKDHAKGKHKKH